MSRAGAGARDADGSEGSRIGGIEHPLRVGVRAQGDVDLQAGREVIALTSLSPPLRGDWGIDPQ